MIRLVSGPRIRRRVVVHGTVQGVFFRDSCRQEAERRGVAGWVRNDPGGTVSAAFEGEPAAVEDLLSWCRSGPEHATVEQVESTAEPPTGQSGFVVR